MRWLFLVCSCLFGAEPNGLPNISTKDCREFEVFSDLIVWTAREAGADCWAEVLLSDATSSSNDLRAVHFGWDPGFRVGARYRMHHDDWDTKAYYTWFYSKGTDSVSSSPGTVHSAFLGNFYVNNPTGLGLTGPAYQKAGISWTIHFNMFDWDLGREFWVSEELSCRPFIGVKGGCIAQSIDSTWETPNLAAPLFYATGKERLKNDFWGLGPQVGLASQWYLVRSFYLLGDFSAGLMWGHWSFGDLFSSSLEQVDIELQSLKSGASMLRAFFGFGWHQNRLSAKLGYEAQIWLDQLQFYSFTGGRLVNELTLQGGTLEFCFDF